MHPGRSGSHILLFLFFLCGLAVAQPNPEPVDPELEAVRNSQAEWFLRGRKSPDGRPSEHLWHAYEQKRRLRAESAAGGKGTTTGLASSGFDGITTKQFSASPSSSLSSAGSTSAVWMPFGPRATATSTNAEQDYGPAVGRVTAIAVDPNDPTGNTVYAGGAYGGVWRSRNAADALTMPCPSRSARCTANVSWEPLLDDQPTLAVGAIAVHPGNQNWILVGTGEAHNSADSYYGMGFLLSKDGGATWSLKHSTSSGESLHGLGITRIVFNPENPNVVVATAAAASAGVRLGAETGGPSARGIYYSLDKGETWHKATVQDPGGGAVTGASANSVVYNASTHRFYANLRFHGFYFSANGKDWVRLPNQPGGALLGLAACPTQTSSSCPLFRAEMAAVPGRNEMYAWIVDANSGNRGIFQTLDGGSTWSAVPTSSMEACGDAIGCGSEQGVYNLTLAAVPDGSITDLYAGAVNLFKCRLTSLTDVSSCKFANLTHAYGCTREESYAHVHPSQHAIGFPVQSPGIVYFGNEGGLYRTLDSFATNSGSCEEPPPQPWFHNMNYSSVPGAGLGSMLQFVSLAQHPTDASILLGGTHGNGSPATSASSASTGVWLAANKGDGGFSAIRPTEGDDWFTSTPDGEGHAFSVNIQRCGLGTSCTPGDFQGNQIIGLAKTGGDASSLYPPYMLDPQAPDRLIAGTCRVWRGDNDGHGPEWNTPGSPLSINFSADPAGSFASTACASSHTMLASLASGGPVSPGLGSKVVWAGQEGDGTSGGELWVTLNADGGPSSWRRALGANKLCSGKPFNPRHYTISDIALDPNDSSGRTAYVTVMGFTDAASGHVFRVQVDDTPAFTPSCTDVSGNLPDVPADTVVTHPASPTSVYVGTDAGVFVTNNAADGATWEEVGPASGPGALPNVVVTRLKIFAESSGALRIRAATYGRGVWEAALTPDLQLVLNSASVFTFPDVPVKFEGKLFALAGYGEEVTITCDSGSGLPFLCDGGASLAPSSTGTPFTVTVQNPSVADFSFDLKATGRDGTTKTYPVTLHVGDFDVSVSPNPLDVPRGTTAGGSISLTTSGTVNAGVNLSCGSASASQLPVGITCTPIPATLILSGAGATATLRVQASQNASTETHALRISAASTDGKRTKTHDFSVTVNVNPRLEFLPATTSFGTAKPGQPLSTSLTLQSLDGYPSGSVNLSCHLSGNPGAATCQVTPSSVNLPSGGTQLLAVSVNTTGALAGDSSLTITADDGATTASGTASFTIQDYRVMTPTVQLIPGGSGSAAIVLGSDEGYSGSVAATCDSAGFAGNPCSLTPLAPLPIAAGGSGTLTLNVTAPVNTPAGNHSILLKTYDTSLPSVIRQTSIPVKVYDFALSAGAQSATIRAGQSADFNVTLNSGADSFPQKVTFACSGLPQLASCTFSPSELPGAVGNGSVQLTIRTTAVTVSHRMPAGGGALAFAWLGMISVGLLIIEVKEYRRIGFLLLLLLTAGLASCGGGGGGQGPTPPIPQPGTPSGAYTITIQGSTTGSLGSAERSTQITLTVQ